MYICDIILGGTCSFSYVVALLLHCKFHFLFSVTVCFVLHLLLGTEKHLNFEAVSTDTNHKFSKQQFGFTIAPNERSFLFFYLIVKKKKSKTYSCTHELWSSTCSCNSCSLVSEGCWSKLIVLGLSWSLSFKTEKMLCIDTQSLHCTWCREM